MILFAAYGISRGNHVVRQNAFGVIVSWAVTAALLAGPAFYSGILYIRQTQANGD